MACFQSSESKDGDTGGDTPSSKQDKVTSTRSGGEIPSKVSEEYAALYGSSGSGPGKTGNTGTAKASKLSKSGGKSGDRRSDRSGTNPFAQNLQGNNNSEQARVIAMRSDNIPDQVEQAHVYNPRKSASANAVPKMFATQRSASGLAATPVVEERGETEARPESSSSSSSLPSSDGDRPAGVEVGEVDDRYNMKMKLENDTSWGTGFARYSDRGGVFGRNSHDFLKSTQGGDLKKIFVNRVLKQVMTLQPDFSEHMGLNEIYDAIRDECEEYAEKTLTIYETSVTNKLVLRRDHFDAIQNQVLKGQPNVMTLESYKYSQGYRRGQLGYPCPADFDLPPHLRRRV